MESDQGDSGTPSLEPTPSEIPKGVPDGLNTIEGVQEMHYASSPLVCHQMNKQFMRQGLRLKMSILPIDATGRFGDPRSRGKRVSKKKGRMYLCLFEGPDAVENRFGLNEDYENAGLPYPEEYPNDYRPAPQPFDDYNYSQDPYMGDPPPSDPNIPPPF
ncbi:MAG: hypothetical protein RBJ76_03205 [Stenomitos frigidus ULC029]